MCENSSNLACVEGFAKAIEWLCIDSESKWIAKVQDSWSKLIILEGLLRQNEIIGGSKETVVNDEQVAPLKTDPFPVVTMTTVIDHN